MKYNFSFLPKLFVSTGALIASSTLFASESGGLAHPVNYYQLIVEKLGIHSHDPIEGEWIAVPGAIVITLLILLLGIGFKSFVNRKLANSEFAPDDKPSLFGFVDLLSDFVYGIAKDLLPHHFEKAMPLMLSMFLFIFISNMVGIVPGFNAPTSLMSMNLVIGSFSFFYYNYTGFKESGLGYLKHFWGPVWWLGPIFMFIELIGHVVRPFSLSFRLAANLFGDHLVLAIFTNLTWLVVPALLTFFGILVAFIQSFIFTLLSGIYISLAVSHDH